MLHSKSHVNKNVKPLLEIGMGVEVFRVKLCTLAYLAIYVQAISLSGTQKSVLLSILTHFRAISPRSQNIRVS